MNRFQRSRTRMVDQQLVARGIRDERVLAAMRKIPREVFVDEGLAAQVYSDSPLPIGEKQTISQPYVVGLMTEALALQGDERVLEVGTGTGYQTAILASLVAWVYSVERHSSLSFRAREILEAMGFQNIVTKCGDGTLGWREFAPFDAILVAAAGPVVPAPLFEQLREGGRLVMPTGSQESQTLIRVTKREGKVEREDLGQVRFVPLVGRFAWDKTR